MKSYKYAQLVFPFAMNGDVRLSSTDSQVLD
jgi:hypothetical protein